MKLQLINTPATNQIRAMTCIMPCKVDMIGQQCRYGCWAQRAEDAERATNKHSCSNRQRWKATATGQQLERYSHPAAARATAMRVKRHRRRVSELAIHHRGKIGLHTMIAGGADACILTTPHRQKLAATRKASRVCSVNFCQLWSNGSSNYACLLFAYEYDHHHAPSLLFGQCCRNCIGTFYPSVVHMYVLLNSTDAGLRVTDAIITSTTTVQL